MKLISEETILFRSSLPQEVYCFSPALLRLDSGRLIASFDLGGPGMNKIPGPRSEDGDYNTGNQCKVYISDDSGEHWKHTADLPMYHARLFQAGCRIWLLGHGGSMVIAYSEDNGENWSIPKILDKSSSATQAPCACHIENGNIYMVLEHFDHKANTWPAISPVVMRAPLHADLTRPESWSYSNHFNFESLLPVDNAVGVPFYTVGEQAPANSHDKRYCGKAGVLEAHVVKIYDQSHNLYRGNSLYLWMRAHTGMTNLAVIACCNEASTGELTLEPVKTPAGATMFYVPCPGGHMKFHIVYDEVSRLYWMASTQATDSMTRPKLLPDDRYNLPDNERHRLQLHFSRNLFDWCFAGMIAVGNSPRESRNYPGIVIDEDDLLVLCRTGDLSARSAHNGNLITFNRIRNFRNLIY